MAAPLRQTNTLYLRVLGDAAQLEDAIKHLATEEQVAHLRTDLEHLEQDLTRRVKDLEKFIQLPSAQGCGQGETPLAQQPLATATGLALPVTGGCMIVETRLARRLHRLGLRDRDRILAVGDRTRFSDAVLSVETDDDADPDTLRKDCELLWITLENSARLEHGGGGKTVKSALQESGPKRQPAKKPATRAAAPAPEKADKDDESDQPGKPKDAT